MRRVHVLHIRNSSGVYGAERVILSIGKNLDKHKYRFILLALQDRENLDLKFVQLSQQVGLEVLHMPVKGRLDPCAVFRLRNILKKYRINIIHCHDFKANFYGLLSTIGLNIKRVVTSHGATRDSLLKKFYLFLDEKVFYKFFDCIIAVSKKIQKNLVKLKINPAKIALVQNGVDFSMLNLTPSYAQKVATYFNDENIKVFGVVGRLYPDKGHRYFILAFAKLQKKYPETRALFVGDGPFRNELARLINIHNLQGKIILCGEQDDMKNIYRQIHFLVIPSLREGLPFVLLEAMHEKIPILATNVGDIPQVIRQNVTGFLIEPRDEEALYTYMIKLMAQKEHMKRIVKMGFQLIQERFSAVKMVEGVTDVYKLLVQ